ncbi:hypothetical protein ACFE04_013932 [Oxalis oulophora]
MAHEEEEYGRLKALKEFDDSKGGVKALVDSGLTNIPSFFVHSSENVSSTIRSYEDIIPTIDLINISSCFDRPKDVVDKVAKAAREFGFFQVINHGINVDITDSLIKAIRGFHEQAAEIKSRYYTRDMSRDVVFLSNVDLFHCKAASWRDTLRVKLGPTLPELDEIPEICRSEILEWNEKIKRLGDLLMELLCEGLQGVSKGRLECLEKTMVGHHYPYCPEPSRTLGIPSHTDPRMITILMQDHIGGLQVKHDGKWLDVKPIPGALVINIGDMLQIISNDMYKSVEHRVVANPFHEPRTSIAMFLGIEEEDRICGPLPELLSQDKPAIYRQFSVREFLTRFYSQKLDGMSLRNYFKL